MSPRLNSGVYAYCILSTDELVPQEAISHFAEIEGVSIIVPVDVADRLGLAIGFQAEWVTLDVHSDLSAVGLTAAVSGALARAGISCNVVAGYHHDHLFVPEGKGREAVRILLELQGETKDVCAS